MDSLSDKGFSFVEIIVGLAVILISYLLATMVFGQIAESQRQLILKIEQAQLHSLIGTTLQANEICSCHVSNPANPDLVIDTSGPTSPPIDLQWLRSSCDFSSTANILATTGQAVWGEKATIESVLLEKINRISTTNKYTGEIVIGLAQKSGQQLSPLRNPIVFEIDPVSKRPTQCVSNSSGARYQTCPPGFTLVGNPEEIFAHCEETNAHPAATIQEAMQTCDAIENPGYSRGRICASWQLQWGCATVPIVKTGQQEFAGVMPNYTGGVNPVVVDTSDCKDYYGIITLADQRPFRCCLY